MPDIPAEAVQAAAEALSRALFSGLPEYGTWLENDEHLARAAVEAAAPLIAEHALRTATLQQHEDMIGRIATEAIERERPKLLAMVEQLTDQAMAEKGAAIRADERSKLLALIQDLTDPDPCQYDHHGGCQAHGYLSLLPGERCPHADAKQLLGDPSEATS